MKLGAVGKSFSHLVDHGSSFITIDRDATDRFENMPKGKKNHSFFIMKQAFRPSEP